jgi:heme oxygenase (biliverdin-IX-beta and delta-forming)
MTASARRFALRAETAQAHATLDAAVGDIAEARAYARYLRGLHAFRAPVEQAFAGAPGAPLAIAALIEQDMQAVGVMPQPPSPPFELPDDASARLGIAYVLEGSALGARVLRRQAASLGLDPRHLAAQTGDPLGWAAFCARLDSAENYDPATAARAARSALAVALAAFERAAPGADD